MTDAKNYAAPYTSRDGRHIEIRAQRPDDLANLKAALERASPQSLFRRFFAVKRHFSERETAYFLNVDFVNHVALVAVATENGHSVIVGGARYVILRPGKAEVACAVIDPYQGQGLGSELMRHLIIIARGAGLEELVAEVLADNASMLKVLDKCGLPRTTKRESDAMTVTMRLV